MKINIRILTNVFATIVLLVVFLPLYLSIIINIPFVQNFVVKHASRIASEHLGSEVSIKNVDINLFYSASIDGFYVEDPLEGDTLIYADKLKAKLSSLKFSEGLSFDYAEIDNINFYLNTDEADSMLNLKYVINKLRSKNPKNKKPFVLNIDNIDITDMNFELRRKDTLNVEHGINYKDMRFEGARLSARDFHLVKDSFFMSIDSLYLTERSGAIVKNVEVDKFVATPSKMQIFDGKVRFENSYMDIESYSMHYSMWKMYDFINKVKLDVKISDAFLDFRDISKFTPRELPMKLGARFKAEASGVISDFDAKITEFSSYLTEIKEIDAKIKGLPKVDETHFDITVNDLASSADDFGKIALDLTGKDVPVMNKLAQLHNIQFNGGFKGLLRSFTANGYLNTNLGAAAFDISNTPIREGLKILGNVDVFNFNVGALLGVKKLGGVSLVGDVDALIGSETVSVDTKALVQSLEYNSYNYRDINVDGKIVNKTFFGYLGCDDSNIDFKFNGVLDLDEELPKYDFNLDIKRADLKALNFAKKDSVSVLSGLLTAEGSGLDIDNINGNIKLDSLGFINSIDTVKLDRVTFVTRNTKDSKYMKLNSEVVDAELRGKQSYSNIFKYLMKSVRTYLPSITSGGNVASQSVHNSSIIDSNLMDTTNLQEAENGYYIASIDVKKANNVASIFMPGLEVSEDTNMSFLFNPAINEFTFNFDSKLISHNNTRISDINISSISSKDSISLYARSKEMMFNNIYIPNFLLLGGIKNNSVNLDSRFFNDNDKSEALISTHSIISRDPETGALELNVSVKPSRFSLGKDKWSASSGTIIVDDSKVKISRFLISANDKSFSVWGDISKEIGDTLSVKVDNFDLSPLTDFTDTLGFKVAGRMDGDFKIASVLNNPRMITNIDFRTVQLNDKVFEDAVFKSDWSDTKQYTVFSLTQEGRSQPLIDGAFKMKEKLVLANVNISDVDISLISPFTKSMFSDLEGSADVNAHVSNPNGKLRIDGKVDIHDFTTTVNFTKVRYSASGTVDINNNHYKLNEGLIRDQDGVTCGLNAELWADGYRNVDYKISATPQKMLFMNTTVKDNEVFYGHIYGSGDLAVIGHGTNVVMNVFAKSENNSTFYMPLSDKTSITEADYIKFVSRDTITENKKLSLINRKVNTRVKNKGSFEINLDMDIQPNLEAQIVIDPTVGDIIKGRGMGNLKMVVNPSADILTINGGVEIIDGSYLFTLSSIINKYFKIQPGSTINWTGDPLDANLNITATYLVKTSLAPLLGNDTQFSKRVEVDCDLSLSGRLLKPDINLGISLPNTDPEVQSYVNSVLNTEEAISTQIFWLLFANTFYADSNNASFSSSGLTTGAAVTGLEFLSNQISNWVSSDKFNIGFSYRPKGDMTSDELELRMSAPILKDKLFLDVEGNLDFKNNTAYVTENLKMFTVDASLTWIIDSLANVTSKLYTRPIDTFDENQGLQEVGVGLYYRYDFDRFSELLKQIRLSRVSRIANKNKKREAKEAVLTEKKKE